MTYFRNIKLWLLGFHWFDQLTFRAGWSADSWQWHLLYLFDYSGPSSTTPTDSLEVRTSRDGFFWVPVGRFDLMETRANIAHHWGIFEAGSELVLAGNYQQYMASGSQALTAVVSLGDETAVDEDITQMNLSVT